MEKELLNITCPECGKETKCNIYITLHFCMECGRVYATLYRGSIHGPKVSIYKCERVNVIDLSFKS